MILWSWSVFFLLSSLLDLHPFSLHVLCNRSVLFLLAYKKPELPFLPAAVIISALSSSLTFLPSTSCSPRRGFVCSG